MASRSVGIATFAACALGASAFLIPAPTDLQSGDNNAQLLSLVPASAKHQAVSIPCSECVFSNPQQEAAVEENDEPLFFIQGGANSIVVNFTVSDDGHRLEVNGEPVYPLGLQLANIFHSPKTYVTQAPSAASVQEIESGEVKTVKVEVTGHGVSVREETAVSDDGETLIPITYSIFEIERQPVSVDEVSVQLMKTASGQLAIMHVHTVAPPTPRPDDFFGPPPEDMPEEFLFPPPTSAHPHHRPGKPDFGMQKECKVLPPALCKFRNALEAKLRGMKKGGCHGRKGGKHGPPHNGHLPTHIKPGFLRPGHDDGRPHGHHGRPHHMRPHGQHHHHHHHGHRFMHAFSRGLAAVLIPTMAGVAVGMTVSLIGLLVGRLIGFLWIKFYRGGRRGYASVALTEESADQLDTEKVFPIEQDELEAPPKYEEAPAYEQGAPEQK